MRFEEIGLRGRGSTRRGKTAERTTLWALDPNLGSAARQPCDLGKVPTSLRLVSSPIEWG